jgi:hypothetical protein
MRKGGLLYLAVFVLLMGFLALATPWQDLDWRLYAALTSGELPAMSNDVVLADTPYDKDPAVFRERVCGTLDALAHRPDERPRVVVLDIQIAEDPRGQELLKACIERTQARGVKVYAAANPLDRSGNVDGGFIKSHAKELYRNVLDGYGHTLFEHKYGAAKYDPYIDLGDGRGLPALPIKLAEQEYARPMTRAQSPIVLRMGDAREAGKRTLRAQGSVEAARPDTRGKVVIVGSLAEDVSEIDARPGPELLAWAISERIVPADSAPPRVLADWRLLLAAIAAFSALNLLCFAGLRVLRDARRARLPAWAIALASGAASSLVLVLSVWGLRQLAYLYPQVSLVVTGIVLSGGLAWLKDWREAEQNVFAVDLHGRDRQPLEQYDVFISYSRAPANAEWVEENVFKPLSQLRKTDGSAVRIFFDRESIKPGTQWYGEIARAIEASRVFVPVYSEDYFERDFCRWEMQKAAIKAVKQPGFVLPVARVVAGIPPEYDHIQWIDVNLPRDFGRALIEAVTAALDAASPARPLPAG